MEHKRSKFRINGTVSVFHMQYAFNISLVCAPAETSNNTDNMSNIDR